MQTVPKPKIVLLNIVKKRQMKVRNHVLIVIKKDRPLGAGFFDLRKTDWVKS